MPLSVIIPTLNEAERIGPLVAALRAMHAGEIIVVDGGSSDDTAAQASGADRVLSSTRGRAAQQNAGATAATGDVMLFLHADCRPQPGALDHIPRTLADPRVVAGCFRQTIDAPGAKYRLLERGNAARVRLLGWAYGDQGIFVRSQVFHRVGGFPDVPLMEDLLLIKRLKREGRIRLVDARLHVSPRRWQHAGVLRQTLRNWRLLLLHHCGTSPARLARSYRDIR